MAITEMVLTKEMIDSISDDNLLDHLQIDLQEYSNTLDCDREYHTTWTCNVEEKEWDISGYALLIGERVCLWTSTLEAGIGDVQITFPDDDLWGQLREFTDDIASQLG